MRFVTIRHSKFGTTTVPESRVPHLADGWSVVTDEPVKSTAKPKKRASRARTTRKES